MYFIWTASLAKSEQRALSAASPTSFIKNWPCDGLSTYFCTPEVLQGAEQRYLLRLAKNLIRPGTKTERENKSAAETCLRPIELSESATHSQADKDGGIETKQMRSWCKTNVMYGNKTTRWLKNKEESILRTYSLCNSGYTRTCGHFQIPVYMLVL